MPDKAVDLMDEAASSLRLQQESKPDAIEALERRIVARSIEAEGLRRETDKASVERRKALEAEIVEKEREMAALTEKWNAEKKKLGATKNAKERLEAARRELEIAERNREWAKASEIKYSVIPELEKTIESSSNAADAGSDDEVSKHWDCVFAAITASQRRRCVMGDLCQLPVSLPVSVLCSNTCLRTR